jgi:hypothetical protein
MIMPNSDEGNKDKTMIMMTATTESNGLHQSCKGNRGGGCWHPQDAAIMLTATLQ